MFEAHHIMMLNASIEYVYFDQYDYAFSRDLTFLEGHVNYLDPVDLQEHFPGTTLAMPLIDKGF